MAKPFVHLSLTRPLAVVDVETTGTSPGTDRIVEIAAVKFMPQGGRRRLHRRVNPGTPIPPSATAVHGITDEDVAGCPPLRAIAPRLARVPRDCDLAGFPLRTFHLPVLLA